MKVTSGAIVTWKERRLARGSKVWLSDVSISFAVIVMIISNGGEIAKEKCLAIQNRSQTLMRFWMSDCCWQLDLGLLISRNQKGLYYRFRHFECIKAIFQICACSELHFSALCLFRLSTSSDSPPFQTLCSFRFFTFLNHCSSVHQSCQIYIASFHFLELHFTGLRLFSIVFPRVLSISA